MHVGELRGVALQDHRQREGDAAVSQAAARGFLGVGAIDGRSGDCSRRSAPSTSLACMRIARSTRSIRKPTPVSAATATNSARNSTARSPERHSRASVRRPSEQRGAHSEEPAGGHGETALAARRQRGIVRHQHQRRAGLRGSARTAGRQIEAPVVVSRLPVGSSANSTAGRVTEARASATRCCSPPESWRG